MLRNYLKIAWRNLIRNKAYSAINIGGRAVGMAVAMLIGLWVHDELSFDKYHKNFELSPALSYGPFKGRSSQAVFNFPVINQQTAQVDDIAQHVLDNKPLPAHISGEEGRKDLKVLEAIYRAANTGNKIRLS